MISSWVDLTLMEIGISPYVIVYRISIRFKLLDFITSK